MSLSLCVQTSSDYITNCTSGISADLLTFAKLSSLALAAFSSLSTCKQMINGEKLAFYKDFIVRESSLLLGHEMRICKLSCTVLLEAG